MDNNKLTKTEMEETILEKQDEIKELKRGLKKLESIQKYEDAANELWSLTQALVNAGYTNDQAFELTKAYVKCFTSNINYK